MYMNRTTRKNNIASIVELFMMFLLLLIVIVVITMVCMTTREQSLHANDLTEAVICAENTAEITSVASDAEEAAEMIERMEGASDVITEGDTITAKVNDFQLEVIITLEEGDGGTYMDKTIKVYQDGKEPLYQLHAGNYSMPGEPEEP